jgi:Bacterial Ig domain
MKALRAAFVFCSLLLPLWASERPAAASPLTLSGTILFSSLDGSAQDADGVANGVFTVNGDLVLDGTINCNDDLPLPAGSGACPIRVAVSGNMVMNAGSGLFAENRRSGGDGGNIALTVGGDLTLHGSTASLPGAVVSSSRTAGASGHAGDVSMDVSGSVKTEAGSAIAASTGSGNAGTIQVIAGGPVQIAGLVASGPSRTVLASRWDDVALSGGDSGQAGGPILLRSRSGTGPGLKIESTGVVVSQGEGNGARLVLLEACGIEVRGLVASLSRDKGPSQVALRSGKGILVDGQDLGNPAAPAGRFGRVRGDGTQQGATGYLVDLFAAGDIQVLGPDVSATNLFAVSSTPGTQPQRFAGGTITGISLGGKLTAAGNAFQTGWSRPGDQGGAIDLRAQGDVALDQATLVSIGDSQTGNPARAGGVIAVRSYQGNVTWTFGTGDVRPAGTGFGPKGQGKITLTSCGTIDITGAQFPVMGSPLLPFPVENEGVCSPTAPSLPSGEPPLPVCNRPPTAQAQSATTKEDTSVTLTLTGSDPDSDPLTFSIVTPPAHGTLGPLTAPTSTSVQVVYTPAANFNGADSFTFQVDDGQGGHNTATVSLTVTPVNDAPSFTAGPNQTVNEDAGPQTVNPWATGISAGPANESGQTLNFQVTGNSNPGLFSAGPAVSPSGALSYTPAPGATGTATITLVLHDDGGTADGGVDTSAAQTFTITVLLVNHPPSFVKGPDVTVLEDAPPQTVSPWATGISPGPGSESSQTVSFLITGNSNPGLFAAGPSVSPTGVLTFTLAPNANGDATVTLVAKDDGGTANGGSDTSAPQSFVIHVTPVNDAPSFTKGPDVTVVEDSGPQTISPWATAISTGPADEGSQTVTFNVTGNTNPGLFSAGPAVSPGGVLTFAPAPNANGTASITLTLQDSGGTANGGIDTSAPQTFTITVAAVNDAPSFVKGPDVNAFDNNGAVTVNPWATAISAGPPDESGQTVAFQVVGNSNPGLFAVAPAVSPTGVLTFTPAIVPPGTSTATITLQLKDNGGTANGGVDTSGTQSFVISITHVNSPPHLVASPKETFDTVGNTALEFKAAQGLPVSVFVSGNLVSNFTDSDGPQPISASLVSASPGASVTVNSDGTFTYVPPAGATGSDTFTYSVTDGADTVTRTVTIHFLGRVWYVKNDADSGGLGRSTDPFNTLAAAQGASAANDTNFVYGGDLTTNGQAAGITLQAGQKLYGEAYGLTINTPLNGVASTTLVAADAGKRPKIDNTASGGNAVTVTNAGGVEVRGLSLAANANAVNVTTSGANSGGATITDNAITGSGQQGIKVAAGGTGGTAVTVQNNTITATGNGLDARSTAGALVLAVDNNTGITSGANGIFIDGSGGGSTTITSFQGNSIHQNTLGTGIAVTSALFDAAPGGAFQTVSGGTTLVGIVGNGVGGAGIVLTNVAGDLAFADLQVVADGGAGLRVAGTGAFTGSAGLQITLSNGGLSRTVVATGGPAVDVSNATVSLPFQQINSTNSPTTGVALNSVAGSFAAGSGSSISSTSGTAFQVGSSNAAISYAGTISTTTGTGVNLTSNTGSTIGFTGTMTLSTGSNPAFTATGGGTVTATDASSTLTTTTGTALNVANTAIGAAGLKFRSISAGTAASGPTNGIVLNNTGVTGTLTVSGTGGASTGGTIQKTGAEGILITGPANASFSWMAIQNPGTHGISSTTANNLTIANTTITDAAGNSASDDGLRTSNTTGTLTITSCTINGARHQGITIDNNNTNMAGLSMTGTTVTNTPGGDGMLIQMRGTSVLPTGTISGNTFSNNSATGLQVNNADTGNIQNLTVQSNTVSGNNAGMDFDLSQASSMTIVVQSNTITGSHSQALNLVTSTSATGGSMTATLRTNNIGTAGVNDSGSAIGNGIRVANGGINISLTIDGNIIREVPNGRGIDIEAQAYTPNLNLKAKIINNQIIRPSGTNQNIGCGANVPCPSASIFVLSDSNGLGGFDHVCTVITGNSAYDPTSWPAGGEAAFYFARRTSASNTLSLEGTQANVTSQIQSTNTVTNFTSAGVFDEDTSGTVAIVPAGTCGGFPS